MLGCDGGGPQPEYVPYFPLLGFGVAVPVNPPKPSVEMMQKKDYETMVHGTFTCVRANHCTPCF